MRFRRLAEMTEATRDWMNLHATGGEQFRINVFQNWTLYQAFKWLRTEESNSVR